MHLRIVTTIFIIPGKVDRKKNLFIQSVSKMGPDPDVSISERRDGGEDSDDATEIRRADFPIELFH